MFGKRKRSDSDQQGRVLAVLEAGSREQSTQSWFEEIVEAIGGEPIGAETLATLTTRLHEATGAYSESIAEEHEAHRWLWRTLAQKAPENAELALLAVDADYHHGGDPIEALRGFLATVRKSPSLLYKTGLYGELYEVAREAGPRVWMRYRLIEILAAANELSDSESLCELVGEVIDELDDVFAV